MSIRVTCTSCHTRFDVSDKFAGKEGPCPKCKTTINIPDVDEQVVIHAPEHTGPKDSKGRAVLKPISRSETVLSGVQIALIIAGIVGFLAAALVMRNMITEKDKFPLYLLAISAIAIAIPIAYLAYSFLRNQESTSFFGPDLWARLGICAAIYSVLWLVMPLMGYAFPSNDIGAMIGIAVMIAGGGMIGMYALEFDYIFGVIHYGMYLGFCLLARLIVGLDVLPGAFGESTEIPSTVISCLWTSWISF